MIATAKRKAKQLGTLKNSIMNGEGNLTGFLGEEVVKSFLEVKSSSTKNYDIKHGGKTYDVKTKLTSKPPLPDYDCSIASYNTVQQCDAYIFVRIEKDLDNIPHTGWLLGWIEKEKFFKNAEFWPKGKIDPANGYRVRANCYNLKIKELNSPESLKS